MLNFDMNIEANTIESSGEQQSKPPIISEAEGPVIALKAVCSGCQEVSIQVADGVWRAVLAASAVVVSGPVAAIARTFNYFQALLWMRCSKSELLTIPR